MHVAVVEELSRLAYRWSVSLLYFRRIVMLILPPDTCVCEGNILLVLVLADSVVF
jgi:hypothetical protein